MPCTRRPTTLIAHRRPISVPCRWRPPAWPCALAPCRVMEVEDLGEAWAAAPTAISAQRDPAGGNGTDTSLEITLARSWVPKSLAHRRPQKPRRRAHPAGPAVPPAGATREPLTGVLVRLPQRHRVWLPRPQRIRRHALTQPRPPKGRLTPSRGARGSASTKARAAVLSV